VHHRPDLAGVVGVHKHVGVQTPRNPRCITESQAFLPTSLRAKPCKSVSIGSWN
jgi:hypothetical protein